MGDMRETSGRTGGRRRPGGPMRRVTAVAAAGALLLAACGDGDEDAGAGGSDDDGAGMSDAELAELLGPEDAASGEPVRLGMVSDGATESFDNTDELRAAEAAAEYWNTHRGGVGGRPIEVVGCETGATPSGAQECANQFLQEDVVAVTLSQSAVQESVWEPLHAEGVPTMWFQASGQGPTTDTESSFVIMNPLTTLFGLPISVADSEGTDEIAFVVIDVPQARAGVETMGPTILGEAGLDHEIIPIAPGTADMTAQMQQVADSGAGVVHLTGNDAFCIAAFNGLAAVGYEGAVTAVSQCITDATREGVSGDVLEGTYITASIALGATEDPTYRTYRAVMDAFGEDVTDVNNNTSMGAYSAMGALATALQTIPEGEVTPGSATEAIRTMDEAPIPGGGGVTFQCGGSAIDMLPAVCTNEWLRTTLDDGGDPTTYQAVDSTDILPDAP